MFIKLFFKNKKMKFDSDKLIISIFKALTHLPNRILFLLADFGYFVLFRIIKYRKNIIYTNLKNSFPEKTSEEIDSIAKKFYSHMADMVVEALMFYRMTDTEIEQHLKVTGMEICEDFFKQKRGVIVLGMHYNNWEWNAALQRKSSHQLLMIYNPVRRNKNFERLILDMRERFGGLSVPVHLSARKAIEFNNSSRPGILWLAADQTPDKNVKFWTTFLNQETPFFSGPEKIAIKTNSPIVFLHTRKLSRGNYESNVSLMFENPAKETPEDILLAYVDRLEKIISEEPQYWLWSHRRWKHSRSAGIELVKRKHAQ